MKLSRTIGAVATALSLTILVGCGGERSGDDVSGSSGSDETDKTAVTTFGDLPTPCGEGDAKGATDQGITDTEIQIGYGDDRGFTYAPGLSEEVGDAMDAMVKWCNDQGGINGRTIVGTRYDAALTIAVQVMQKACKQDFMLVGQGFAYDEAAEPDRVACGLPSVPAFAVGPNASMGPDKFEPLPFPADYYNAAGLALAIEALPEFKEGPAMISGDTPAVQVASAKVVTALESLGVTAKDCGVSISQVGEASYAPFAEKLKSCGAGAVWNTNGPLPSSFGLLEAIQRSGESPQLLGEAQWYSTAGAEWNGATGGAEGMVVPLMVQPLQNAQQVPAVSDYMSAMHEIGGKTAMLGEQATSAFLLWATVAKQCGADLTRECMVEGLSEVHEWTGGGLHAPTDPGANMPTDCALLVQLEAQFWTQIAPETAGEFACDEAYVIPLDPKDSGVELDDNRISTAFSTN
jgi:ABC-type branched-subunit amino acid transport system substrate-binding protein